MVIVALSSYIVSTRLRKKWFSVSQLLAKWEVARHKGSLRTVSPAAHSTYKMTSR